MSKWYVVQVLSSQEKKVKKVLEEQARLKGMDQFIERILLPIEHVSEVKRGQQRITEKRVWPGYLLVRLTLTDESWMFVKNTQGVVDFLGGDKPTSLSEEEVQEILQDLEDKTDKVVHKHKFEVGDRVKINDGVFVNFSGSVIEVFHDKGRLSVMVSIFGRETRVDDLEFWQVEELPAGAEE
ncbi:MAG: transcription antitermination protein NusG [Chlamydiales bacterium]|jgi:transcriptional antiterminator NusG|nr:transcription antitermination protein NusG [Chlamydiales bacterium]